MDGGGPSEAMRGIVMGRMHEHVKWKGFKRIGTGDGWKMKTETSTRLRCLNLEERRPDNAR